MSKPLISLIWAEDRNGLIGQNGGLPWHLPEDMAWFRQQTMGKAVLMGRKTFDSIGKPLPGRFNMVQSRGKPELPDDCHLIHCIDEALAVASDHEELVIMGGSEIYRLWLPLAERLYVTHLEHNFTGDAYFPATDRSRWKLLSRQDHQAATGYCYRFCIYNPR